MMSSRLILAGWAAFALATGLAFLFLVGVIAFAIGFTGATIVSVYRKKWIPAVVCFIQVIAAALMLLGYMFEMPWDQWIPEPWRTVLSVVIFTLITYVIVRLILKKDKKGNKNRSNAKPSGGKS